MLHQRQRPWLVALGVILVAWAVAIGGYYYAKSTKVTVEKVLAKLHDTDLSKLSAADRAKRLRELADMLNALSYNDRRTARMNAEWNHLFASMTDAEKGDFLDATLPTGFKQMLTAFEQMPEEQRKRAVDGAVRRLKEAEAQPPGTDNNAGGTNRMARADRPDTLSPELQQKFIRHGLQSYYSDSSAQTKADLAPFMEELQKSMENGRVFTPRQR